MANSSNLVLPYLEAGQAQKHVTVNSALRKLDAIVQLSVVSATTTAQPGSPTDGEVYILPSGKTGAEWGSMATGSLAYYRDGAWEEIIPKEGWRAWVKDTCKAQVHDGAAWRPFLGSLTPNNSSLAHIALEEELTLAGASVNSTIQIPNGSIVFGVSERVTLAVTGATSFAVGISGETTKFGSSLGLSLGSTNFGIIGPTAFYADTQIVVTAAGSNFTGGKVRIAIHAVQMTPPQS